MTTVADLWAYGVYAKASATTREHLAQMASLLSVDGENAEYDRALTEAATMFLGLPSDDYRDAVYRVLRVIA